MEYRDSVRLGEQLRAWMLAEGLTEEQLAALVSAKGMPVSQSWISRICAGRFKRTGGKTGEVLRFAGIETGGAVVADKRGRRVLAKALNEVWDGSLQGAIAIAGVLRSAGAMARKGSPLS